MNSLRLETCFALVAGLVLMGTGAGAQIVETAMRGNTIVAAPSTSTSWVYNPAALGAGMPPRPAAAPQWRRGQALSVDVETGGDSDLFAVNLGGVSLDARTGLGAGYWDMSQRKVYGLGVGRGWEKVGVGVSWKRSDPKRGSLSHP